MNTITTTNTQARPSRLNLTVPANLAESMNHWAEKLDTTLNDLHRKALLDYLEKLEQGKIERELAEACKNYRAFNKKFSSEWARYETRIK